MNKDTTFYFDRVLFFGRSIAEYQTMFNLNLDALAGKTVLDCSSGPAALASQAKRLGATIIACDPLYNLPPEELHALADRDAETVRTLQERTMSLFDEAVRTATARREDMSLFLADYPAGKKAGRYVPGQLPTLPFKDKQFDLTLCSNFLFLYADTKYGGIMNDSPFDYDFHLNGLTELARVTAEEVRLYPLNGPECSHHAFLDDLIHDLKQRRIEATLIPVEHRDIKTATHLLQLRHANDSL